jgi:hypothetical protein
MYLETGGTSLEPVLNPADQGPLPWFLAARRNRPCGCGSADKRDELPSSHVLPLFGGSHPTTLLQGMPALCITPKLAGDGRDGSDSAVPRRPPHVRSTLNICRDVAAPQSAASCHKATYALQQFNLVRSSPAAAP